ncbi:MAG: DNRLRE domain-containing protein [Phycisphaerales bacterium]
MNTPLRRVRAMALAAGLAAVIGTPSAMAAAGGAGPEVAEVVAMRDNTLYTIESVEVSNGAGVHLFAGHLQFIPDGVRRALLRFDVAAAVPPGMVVATAELRLVATRAAGANNPMTLHRVLADWGEGASDAGEPGGEGIAAETDDATWINRFFPGQPWAAEGGDFEGTALSTLVVSGVGTHTWPTSPEFVAAVQGWASDPATNFGLIVVGHEVPGGTAKRFSSRESPVEEQRPRLLLTFAPACALDYNLDTVLNPDDLGDFITDYYTSPHIAGPGGYAIACPENQPPYDAGYKTAYTVDGSGQCNEPFPDNLGDFITAYFQGC